LSETVVLVIVLGLVYAAECVVWLTPDSWFLSAPWLQGASLSPTAANLRIAGRPVVAVNPVPPFGLSFSVSDPPFEADPHVIWLNGQPSPAAWEALRDTGPPSILRAFHDRLEERGYPRHERDFWIAQLERLAAVPTPERGAALNDFLERRTHLLTARERLVQVRDATHPVRMIGGLQWLLIAAGIPTAAMLGVLGASALPMFGLVMLIHLSLVWLSGEAHCELYGARPRVQDYVMMGLSPLHSLRAAEHLGRSSMVNHDPSTVVLAAGRPEDFLAMAGATYRELSEPTAERDGARAWWRESRLRTLTGLLREARISPAHLDLAIREDHTAQSFCPQCRTLYAESTGFCHDCAGVSLRRLSHQQILDSRSVMDRIRKRAHRGL
jgi:hypothetical protein